MSETPMTSLPAVPGALDAGERVRAFLAAAQARDLPLAETFLAPGFEMHFPGPVHFHRLTEFVDWARTRYRRVAKRIERTEQVRGDGVTVVYCLGTLHGEWPDGQPFDGIRFIDRFEVVDGLLVRQDVWNDMAEHRSPAAA